MFDNYIIYTAILELGQDMICKLLEELQLAAKRGLVKLKRQQLTETAFAVCLPSNDIFWDIDTINFGVWSLVSNINYFLSAAALARINIADEKAAIEDIKCTLRDMCRQIYAIK